MDFTPLQHDMPNFGKELKIPLTTELAKFCNYAHAIMELRFLCKKLAEEPRRKKDLQLFPEEPQLKQKIKSLGNIFVEEEERIDVQDVLDGFLHQKIEKRRESFEDKVYARFISKANAVISEIKESQYLKNALSQTIHSSDVKFLEDNFDRDAVPSSFSRTALSDLYFFLRKQATSDFQDERRFLETQFLNYIRRFYKENSEKILATPSTLESKISEFVKLRYNKSDYNIEVFEGRYLYAEVYVLLRCGLLDSIKAIVQGRHFFPAHFVDKLTSYIENPLKVYQGPTLSPNDDKFKQIIFKIMFSPEFVQPNSVISTLEDYFWIKCLAIEKGFSVNFDELLSAAGSPISKLLASVLAKDYCLSQEILLKGEFNTIDVFYLCTELNKKKHMKGNLFVNFIFLVAKKFSSVEKKAALLRVLGHLTPRDISKKIVEYEMYEVVNSLPEEYGKEVIGTLRNSNNKRVLLRLHYMNDNEQEIACMLEDAMSEEISSERAISSFDEFENSEVYFYLQEKYGLEGFPRLKVLKGFLDFKIKRDLPSMQQTALFDESLHRMLRGLSCIDTVIVTASEVIQNARCPFFARKLMNVTGRLVLAEHTQKVLLNNLIAIL